MVAPKFKVLSGEVVLQNQTVSVASDYTPPEAGRVNLRLTGYVEQGVHKGSWQGKETHRKSVALTFELSGKKWEPKKLDSGEIVPQRMNVTMSHTLTSRSKFYKLFLAMRNGREEITHMSQLLGEAFIGTIRHEEYEDKATKVKKISAKLTDADGNFTITPPVLQIPELDEDQQPTGNFVEKVVKVSEPIGDYRLFIWDNADQEQWDSLYIAGDYEGKTKNVIQLKICSAENFPGSLAEALAAGSDILELAAKGVGGTADVPDGDEGEPDDPDAANTKGKAGKTVKSTPKPEDEPKEEAGKPGINDID